MSANDVITLIDAEVAKLEQARALIAGTGRRRPGRRRPTAIKPKKKKRNLTPERRKSTADKPKKRKWNVTPEGRARIAEAVRKRWATQKKAAK